MPEIKEERIPLELLIQKGAPLWKIWKMFSIPQQVVVKAYYGLPLETEQEKKAWAVFNDSCEMDDLGIVTEWTPVSYTPRERKIIVGLMGRRGGKSLIMSFILLYEIIFGGHTAHALKDTPMVVPYVAQDLDTAMKNMKYVSILAHMDAKIAKEIVVDNRNKIEFRNGIIITPEPPTIKTGRGVSIPVLVMDEVAFWYKNSDNANPDYEVLNALRFAQTQFGEKAKILIISTPYTEEGLLWEYWLGGTDGCKKTDPSEAKRYDNVLVLTASTAALENPEIHKHGRKVLEEIQQSNPEIFVRESLARFVASQSNFIPGAMIDECTDRNVKERSRAKIEESGLRPMYMAVMDPAFKNDDFAFTIGHLDATGKVIQDFLHVWTPDKKGNQGLKPDVILGQIGQWCQQWSIPVVYSDQYHLDSLQSIAQGFGFSIIMQQFTSSSKAKIYGSLTQLMKSGRIRFLDLPVIRQQLSQLNQKQTALGNVQIGAPPGKHDDVATVCALLAHVALKAAPQIVIKPRTPSLFEQLVTQHKKKQIDMGWEA